MGYECCVVKGLTYGGGCLCFSFSLKLRNGFIKGALIRTYSDRQQWGVCWNDVRYNY